MDPTIRNRKFEAIRVEENAGNIADSMEVRMTLIAKMDAGEMTLEQVQAELKRIKRNAKKNGKITRNQAFREG
jgi:hypothetical protein